MNPSRLTIPIAMTLSLLAPVTGCAPESWEARTRKESIRILEQLTSTNGLEEAVGNGGIYLILTNGSWIAIRNVVEYEPERELALARDSGGEWFAATTKFSGGLTWYRNFKQPLEPGEPRQVTSECFALEHIEAAPSLEEARKRLQQELSFVPFRE